MSLMRSAATVGGFTMTSRVLGFVRDGFIAAALGTGPVADAFVVAFRFPNLFRRLFAEGAFNSAFVPLFAKRLEGEGDAAAIRFGEEAMSALLAGLLILTAIAEIAMPVLMFVMAPGFAADPEKFDLTVLLTRIAFPYLALVSMVALFSGVLNARGRFAAAAFAPALLNIALIAALVVVFLYDLEEKPEAGIVLAWGTLVGGVLQLVLVVVDARRVGMRIVPRWPKITPEVKRLAKLAVPGIVSGGVTQINIVVGTIIASLAPGAVAYLYFADRIYQLPLGVVGVAVGVVLLPELSRRLRAGDAAGVDSSQNRALELSLFLTLPAALALMAIPIPIIQVLFERAAFGHSDTIATAEALAAYGAGLPAFVLIKVLQPGFFAREDTATPMRYAIIGVVANIALALALFPFLVHVGIALATTLSAWLTTAMLAVTLTRRGHFQADAQLRRRVPRIVLASLAMGIVLLGCEIALDGWFTQATGIAVRALLLLGLTLLGAAVYFGLAYLTGAFRPAEFKRALRRS